MITDLRNPCMKLEHWKTLESIVGTSVNVTELTVALLENINVFSYGAEIQEVEYKKPIQYSTGILYLLHPGC